MLKKLNRLIRGRKGGIRRLLTNAAGIGGLGYGAYRGIKSLIPKVKNQLIKNKEINSQLMGMQSKIKSAQKMK